MSNYSKWIPNRVLTDKIEEADIVFFEGGEDWFPGHYNQPVNPKTSYNLERDEYEIAIFNKAQELGKFCVGICRGAQGLSWMSGSLLIQHQDNPYFKHMMHTYRGDEIIVTSTHHQAMYPFNMDEEAYRILGWTKNISDVHEDGMGQEMDPDVECEVVYYYDTKCLCIQSHPEIMDQKCDAVKFFLNLINRIIEGDDI